MTNETMQQTTEITQESKNLGLFVWLGTLFFGFIPGIIFYMVKKDDDYVQDQAKESLNWSITAIIGYILAMLLSFILIGMLLFPIIGLCHLVFCIMGAMAASKGKQFRVPFAIRLMK